MSETFHKTICVDGIHIHDPSIASLVLKLRQELEEKEELGENQRKEIKILKREKKMDYDPRLNCFAQNINGSTDNQNLNKFTRYAKTMAKKTFTKNGEYPLRCVICDKEDSADTKITIAHLISSALTDYRMFGIENGYKDNMDVFSIRNYIPLCGTNGSVDTCHDAMDKHLIYIRYDPIHQSYYMECSPSAPKHFFKFCQLILNTPPGWNPYRRLLAWRSRKCGTEYGFCPNFEQFEAMNQISENSNSIGPPDDNVDDEDADTIENV